MAIKWPGILQSSPNKKQTLLPFPLPTTRAPFITLSENKEFTGIKHKDTAVCPTKVVPQSVQAYATMPIGIMGSIEV